MSNHHKGSLPLLLDWDGTVTERDSLHMVIERFGDPAVFDALEEEVGRRLTLDEVIRLEMATITAPLEEVVAWMLAEVRIRPARHHVHGVLSGQVECGIGGGGGEA